MPKDRGKRSRIHAPSAKLKKPQSGQDQAEVIGDSVKSNDTPTGVTSLKEPTTEEDTQASLLTKKEKQQLKREAFMQKLQTGITPFGSKSHVRREKRKARERLAGGELNEIQKAIIALDDNDVSNETDATATSGQKKPSLKPGMIGEGRKSTLSAVQRRRALQLEQARQPLILSNPQFAANPFQAIRTHAKNTLVKHQAPS